MQPGAQLRSLIVIHSWKNTSSAQVAITFAVSIISVSSIFAQQVRNPSQRAPTLPHAQSIEEKLQQIMNDKPSYATSIVRRWEDGAKANGRWGDNFATDLYDALMSLRPEALLAAGEASTYSQMLTVVASNRKAEMVTQQDKVMPPALGDFRDDLVYTPINPCRIVDTRNAGGPLAANTTRSFEVDVAPGGNYVAQGGSNTDCGIPNDSVDAVTAAAITITVTQGTGFGFLTVWAVAFPQPFSSVINFNPGQTIAANPIVPVNPGGGADINVFAGAAGTQVIIDVVGYFAAPLATALDCTSVSSAFVSVPFDVYTAVDAVCPAGRTATGGGWLTNEGTLGYPNVWILSLPGAAYGFNGWRVFVDNQNSGNRNIQAWATCCRVPGR
jgi:hypothetical protein